MAGFFSSSPFLFFFSSSLYSLFFVFVLFYDALFIEKDLGLFFGGKKWRESHVSGGKAEVIIDGQKYPWSWSCEWHMANSHFVLIITFNEVVKLELIK